MTSRKKHILVVDDDQSILDCIRMSLHSEQEFRVQAVGDPVEALDLIRSKEYNLIISDIQMPGLSG